MSVNFYLDKRTDKKGDAPIRVSIVIGKPKPECPQRPRLI